MTVPLGASVNGFQAAWLQVPLELELTWAGGTIASNCCVAYFFGLCSRCA